MVSILMGLKGSGKTKRLVEMVREAVTTTYLRLDTTRLKALGWQPTHNLKEMFEAII